MSSRDVSAPVVAGVDGTPDGERAALHAASMAAAMGHPLLLLHAYRRSAALSPLLPIGPPAGRAGVAAVAYAPYASTYNEELMRAAGDGALTRAEALVRERHPDLVIRRRLVRGSPASALVAASKAAVAVVVTRVSGRAVEHLLAGSTTWALTAHATAPVVAVPADWALGTAVDTVVVGIEGVPEERAALRFAFDAAASADAGLVVVHACRKVEEAHADVPAVVTETQALSDEDERVIAESLAGWAEEYPQVRVTPVFTSRGAVSAILGHADAATLVVVGARAGGGLARLQLGSTARAVIAHAPCPVAVVHAAADQARARRKRSAAHHHA